MYAAFDPPPPVIVTKTPWRPEPGVPNAMLVTVPPEIVTVPWTGRTLLGPLLTTLNVPALTSNAAVRDTN